MEARARGSVLAALLTTAALAFVVRVAFTPQQPQAIFAVGSESTALRGVARAEAASFTGASNESATPERHQSTIRSSGKPVAREHAPNFAWVSMQYPLNWADNLKGIYMIYALAKSIRRHSGYPLVVLTDLETLEPRDSFHKDMQRLRVQFLRMVQVTMSQTVESQLRNKRPRWYGAYQKLQVFNLTQYDRLVWVDSDSVLTDQLDHLFHLQGYWSQGDAWNEGECRQPNRKQLPVNSGLLAMKPSHEVFKGILAKGEELAAQGKLRMGDQEVVDAYFKDTGQPVHILDQEVAGFGRCWKYTPEKPVPRFLHKPLGYKNCLKALSQLSSVGMDKEDAGLHLCREVGEHIP